MKQFGFGTEEFKKRTALQEKLRQILVSKKAEHTKEKPLPQKNVFQLVDQTTDFEEKINDFSTLSEEIYEDQISKTEEVAVAVKKSLSDLKFDAEL